MSRGYATSEEVSFIKEYVLIPIVLTVFERDSEVMKQALKSPQPYVDALGRGMDLATIELTHLKNFFRSRGIKVYEQKRNEVGISASYACRGYRGSLSLLWSLIAADVDIRKRRYLGENVEKILHESEKNLFLCTPPPFTSLY
ncbi:MULTISPECIES: hypothetical protein [unclassified Paenibacillus]|uniref:hypothetical protein n=1 Tax=unclassified Paenibacillus TaxID=185978 RepID=UPI00020D7BAD|nr:MULTISPECIES: hypothetical protein [unclassified Paenibacillus]EGL18549.1 hypothetical protein HMPREF9413_5919 [Paenibacillus sp. HGF7]EPD80519.1 hypothetical protein HMPREF1207_05625 [Paenibacillus sp. HGH0039]